MARNVEIKARVADLAEIEARVRRLATEGPIDLVQDDTFFAGVEGRLKLRELSPERGELIHYARADQAGPKVSDYRVAETSAPAALREVLSRALGVAGRVRKRRRVYLAGRTRIHFDEVAGLGSFVELEVVLRDGESAEEGMRAARGVMADLEIGEGELVACAYVDLLNTKG